MVNDPNPKTDVPLVRFVRLCVVSCFRKRKKCDILFSIWSFNAVSLFDAISLSLRERNFLLTFCFGFFCSVLFGIVWCSFLVLVPYHKFMVGSFFKKKNLFCMYFCIIFPCRHLFYSVIWYFIWFRIHFDFFTSSSFVALTCLDSILQFSSFALHNLYIKKTKFYFNFIFFLSFFDYFFLLLFASKTCPLVPKAMRIVLAFAILLCLCLL